MRLAAARGKGGIARQFFLLQLGVLAVLVVCALVVAYVELRAASEARAANVSMAVARTVARSPEVRTALAGPDPSASLQTLVETVRQANHVDFIVVTRPDRIRYTHRDPTRLGTRVSWDITPVLNGNETTLFYQGRLGTSVRATAPVVDSDSGQVVGAVSVVMTQPRIGGKLQGRLSGLLVAAAFALIAAAFVSFVISRRLRRQTLGLGPVEITRMYEHHDAVLHTMSQGLVLVGPDRRLLLANDEAQRLLGLTARDEGRPVGELTESAPLRDLLVSGRTAEDQIHLARGRVLVVSQRAARREGRRLGTVATLRDHTELMALTGELDSARAFAESLRTQTHEAANRLHTVITLIQIGKPEQAVEFATAELAADPTSRLVESIVVPAVAALLLGKIAAAQERGVQVRVSDDTALGETSIAPRDLVTVLGNLIDNAIDAAQGAPPPRRVVVTVHQTTDQLIIRVHDTGPGLPPALVTAAFTRGWSTKPADGSYGRGLGLALVAQTVRRHNGHVDVTTAGGTTFTARIPLCG